MYNIPGYEPIEALGESFITTVWKAYQVSVKREVCVKTLKPEFSADQTEVDRFISEARHTSDLNHPAVVQIYDVLLHEGMYHIVMEYVSGPTVESWLGSGRTFPVKRAFEIGLAVADVLRYAWERDHLIHRNISPKSVLLDRGKDVKLGYIGLSLRVDPLEGSHRLAPGAVEGTPYYMAPEQARGDSALDTRADMYGLGCTLYHMITGRMPFASKDALTAIDLQIEGQIPHPRRYVPSLNPAASVVLERLLMKDPAARYADWASVVAGLERALSGKIVVSKGKGLAGSTIAPYAPVAKSRTGVGAREARRPRVRIVKKGRRGDRT